MNCRDISHLFAKNSVANHWLFHTKQPKWVNEQTTINERIELKGSEFSLYCKESEKLIKKLIEDANESLREAS